MSVECRPRLTAIPNQRNAVSSAMATTATATNPHTCAAGSERRESQRETSTRIVIRMSPRHVRGPGGKLAPTSSSVNSGRKSSYSHPPLAPMLALHVESCADLASGGTWALVCLELVAQFRKLYNARKLYSLMQAKYFCKVSYIPHR